MIYIATLFSKYKTSQQRLITENNNSRPFLGRLLNDITNMLPFIICFYLLTDYPKNNAQLKCLALYNYKSISQ